MEDPQKEARQWCTGYALVFLFALLFAGGAFAQELENEVLDPREDTKPRPSVGDLPSQALKGPNAIVTDKGSQIQGKFEGIEGGRFVINDPQLGKIKVKSTDISSLLLGDPYRIWFQETNDSAVKEGRMSPVFFRDDLGDLRVRVHSFNESGLDEYLILDPSKLHKVSLSSYSLKPPEWKFTGNISAAFEWADGNRTRINYGYNTWFKLQHPSHIFDFRNDFLYAETDSVRSAQRGNAEFSYRFLFTTHNAVFYRQLFSHDDFAKLAVRSITSLGLTFYFYKEPTVTWY
ncbi:MAG: DUF481 domain-containing protein, partial [Planctomycetes bacterium]|nr:DUF481 domain-containing protein [Planctomycetota bacterium]